MNSYVMSGLSLSYQHFLNLLFIFRDNGQEKIQERDVLAPLRYFHFVLLLAPTGALVVMMVQLFEFSLSPLMKLILQVSL